MSFMSIPGVAGIPAIPGAGPVLRISGMCFLPLLTGPQLPKYAAVALMCGAARTGEFSRESGC